MALYGWVGKILRVDLTTGLISEVPTANYVPKYIGGRGVGAKIHWDEILPSVGAFDPQNILTFMTGPLAGTPAPSASRTTVQAVSPMTYPEELYASSTIGGHWGPELKFAGYDGIIIQGKSPSPVYLWIHDGQAEIREAKHLWGLNTYATQQVIWETHGKKTRILTIGPAGEHLVRMAIILSDVSSTSGTPGYGAVMGAKNLKAIAVNGTGGVPVARPKELLDIAYYYQRLTTRKEDEKEPPPKTRQQRCAAGSYLGSKLEDEAKHGTIRAGISGCFACPVCCGLSIKIKDGSLVSTGDLRCLEMLTHEREQSYYGGKPKGRPAYETWTLADQLGISNVRFWERSWFLTLIDKGILTKENTGLPIDKLGSVEFYRELLHKTSYREGIGDLLAEGESRVCNYFGGEAIPVWEVTAQVAGKHGGAGGWNENKLGAIIRLGSTISGLDGRGLYHHSYDPKKWVHPPGCKCGRCTPLTPEEYHALKIAQDKKWYGSEKASDLTTWEYKAPTAKQHIDWRIMTDSLVTCMNNFPLTTCNYTPDKLGDISIERRLYSAVTGIDMTEEEWTRTAERIYMLERAILTRHGHTRTEDWFFESLFATNSKWLDKEGLRRTMDEYYTLRGIDVATGISKKSTLEKLGLKDVVDDLENIYAIKLPE